LTSECLTSDKNNKCTETLKANSKSLLSLINAFNFQHKGPKEGLIRKSKTFGLLTKLVRQFFCVFITQDKSQNEANPAILTEHAGE